jgi:hypothetical protein
VDLSHPHDQLARRFAAAWDLADTAALRVALAADAVLISDGGGGVPAPLRPLHGPDEIAGFLVDLLDGCPRAAVTVECVNGGEGPVLRRAGRAVAVAGLNIHGAKVTTVWVVLNPAKLLRWHRR